MKKNFLTVVITLMFSFKAFGNEACNDTVLHGYMVNIKSEMWAMSSDIKSGNYEAASDHLGLIIIDFEKARLETPYKFQLEGIEGEQLKEEKAQFIRSIDSTIDVLRSLNLAIQSGNTKDIRKWLSAVGKQRNRGHNTFKAHC